MDSGGNLMTKARDLANGANAFDVVSVTELEYLDGVTSAIQTQINTVTTAVNNVDATPTALMTMGA
jgi:hypothetical protein